MKSSKTRSLNNWIAKITLVFVALGCGGVNGKIVEPKTEVRPNILFIMTDDHTQKAISAYGSELIQTPNIDRIAKEGILFSKSFVTNSICAPSRAVMLTGKYSHINGLRDNQDEFNTSQVTFPKLLKENNYQTGLVGKWHLKNTPTGFDYWNILPDQGQYYNPTFINNGDTVDYPGYVTNIITDLAIDVLDNRDSTKPFCLLYQQKAPHRNWMPDLGHLDLFNDKDFPLPDNFYDDYKTRSKSVALQDMRVADMYLSMDMKLQPNAYAKETGTGGNKRHNAALDWAKQYARLTPVQKTAWDNHYNRINDSFKKLNPKGLELARWKYQRYIKDYLRCVVSVDDNVGRILNYLDSNNLTENTIVIYTSDQGFYLGEHGWFDKRFMYEESFSTPLLIRYPAKIPAGQTSDKMVVNIDYAPTLLDFANCNIPAEIQGESIRNICTGDKVEHWRNSIYYHYYQSNGWHHVPKHCGVRNEQYKLIHFYENDEWELYDLKNDPSEMQNLYPDKKYETKIEALKKELLRLKNQYADEAKS